MYSTTERLLRAIWRLRRMGQRRTVADLLRASALVLLATSVQAATFTVTSLGDGDDANVSDNVCATSAGAWSKARAKLGLASVPVLPLPTRRPRPVGGDTPP